MRQPKAPRAAAHVTVRVSPSSISLVTEGREALIEEAAAHSVAQPAKITNEPFSPSPTHSLNIQTLGGLRVTRRAADGSETVIPAAAWRHGRSLALMHYLISRPGFSSTKSAIRDALWPRRDPHQAAAYLSNTVWNLRKAIEAARDEGRFLLVTDAMVRLNVSLPAYSSPVSETADLMPPGAQLDFLAFEARAKQASLQRTPQERMRAARHALAFYTGDFLPECAEPHWVRPIRERLREVWATLSLAIAEELVAEGAADEAIETLERLLSHMPDHERAARSAIELLLAQNRQREARALVENIRAFYKETYQAPLPQSLCDLAVPLLTARRTTIPLPHHI